MRDLNIGENHYADEHVDARVRDDDGDDHDENGRDHGRGRVDNARHVDVEA
jgi:hypothetical protein